jgi:hypothetical protein
MLMIGPHRVAGWVLLKFSQCKIRADRRPFVLPCNFAGHSVGGTSETTPPVCLNRPSFFLFWFDQDARSAAITGRLIDDLSFEMALHKIVATTEPGSPILAVWFKKNAHPSSR